MTKTTSASALAALRAEQDRQSAFQLLIQRAWYDASQNLVMLTLNNGVLMGIPPQLGQEISQFTPEQLAGVTTSPGGYALYWPEEGAGIEITSILAGRFGARKWMEKLRAESGIPLGLWSDSKEAQSEWGKLAGSARSQAKATAARANGAKGGRPRKQVPDVVAVVEEAVSQKPKLTKRKNFETSA